MARNRNLGERVAGTRFKSECPSGARRERLHYYSGVSMSIRKKRNELVRLQQAFEREAGLFHDLSLSILYFTQNITTGREFRQPNHLIVLWQYYGEIRGEDDINRLMDNLSSSNIDRAGLRGCEVGCYAIIEGAETAKFVRMATRAGALFSPSEALRVSSKAQADFMSNRKEGVPEFIVNSGTGAPVFTVNRNPIAVWLNHVLHHLRKTHSGYFPEMKVHLDPFAASLSTIDALLNFKGRRSSRKTAGKIDTHRFRVALSFPGECRSYVAEVAKELEICLGKGSVFYDVYYEPELARPNLDMLLQRIYHDNSELVAVFLSKDYASKEWCGLEWRAIRDLIKKKNDHQIMLLRLGEFELGGLFGIDGYLDLSQRSPSDCAEAIRARLLS